MANFANVRHGENWQKSPRAKAGEGRFVLDSVLPLCYNKANGGYMAYWIERKSGVNEDGDVWVKIPGRKYKTRSGAERGFAVMSRDWDSNARAGYVHPSWLGKFPNEHRIVEGE